jgi:tetratricopeptide (TPR) repeat protein
LKLGEDLAEGGKVAEGLRHCREAVEIYRSLRKTNVGDPDLLGWHAGGLGAMARVLTQIRDHAWALALSREACHTVESAVAADPSNNLNQRLLSRMIYHLGRALMDAGKLDEARRALDEARQIPEEILAKTPGDVEGRMSLGHVSFRLGKAHEGLANREVHARRAAYWREAHAWYQCGHSLYRELAASGYRPSDMLRSAAEADRHAARLIQWTHCLTR